jgi:hypothetical protein
LVPEAWKMPAISARRPAGSTPRLTSSGITLVRVGATDSDRGTELADLVSGYAECLRHSLQGNEDMAAIGIGPSRSTLRQAWSDGRAGS